MTLTRSVKHIVKQAARSAGFDVQRRSPYDLDARRVRLAERNGVTIAFDVGANAGQWARAFRSDGFGGVIVSFEPLAAAFEDLREASEGDPRWSVIRFALGSKPGTGTIHVAANSWSSSLLEMEHAHLEAEPASAYVADEEVVIATLDDVCRDRLGPNDHVYLKLDVQGCEADVMRGAVRTLPQIDIVEMELSIVPLYRGQTLYRETLDDMTARGFALVGVSEEFSDPCTGRLLQFNALFERVDTVAEGGEA